MFGEKQDRLNNSPGVVCHVWLPSLFVRGDPHHDFQFSVLVNYRDTAYPLEIVTVDMLQGTNG